MEPTSGIVSQSPLSGETIFHKNTQHQQQQKTNKQKPFFKRTGSLQISGSNLLHENGADSSAINTKRLRDEDFGGITTTTRLQPQSSTETSGLGDSLQRIHAFSSTETSGYGDGDQPIVVTPSPEYPRITIPQTGPRASVAYNTRGPLPQQQPHYPQRFENQNQHGVAPKFENQNQHGIAIPRDRNNAVLSTNSNRYRENYYTEPRYQQDGPRSVGGELAMKPQGDIENGRHYASAIGPPQPYIDRRISTTHAPQPQGLPHNKHGYYHQHGGDVMPAAGADHFQSSHQSNAIYAANNAPNTGVTTTARTHPSSAANAQNTNTFGGPNNNTRHSSQHITAQVLDNRGGSIRQKGSFNNNNSAAIASGLNQSAGKQARFDRGVAGCSSAQDIALYPPAGPSSTRHHTSHPGGPNSTPHARSMSIDVDIDDRFEDAHSRRHSTDSYGTPRFQPPDSPHAHARSQSLRRAESSQFLGVDVSHSTWLKWSQDRRASFKRRLDTLEKRQKELEDNRVSTPVMKARKESIMFVSPEMEETHLSTEESNQQLDAKLARCMPKNGQQRKRSTVQEGGLGNTATCGVGDKEENKLSKAQWDALVSFWEHGLFVKARYIGIVIASVSLVLAIVSMTNQHWSVYSDHAHYGASYSGLWLICSSMSTNCTPALDRGLSVGLWDYCFVNTTQNFSHYTDYMATCGLEKPKWLGDEPKEPLYWQIAVIGLLVFACAFSFLGTMLGVCGICTTSLPRKVYYYHSSGEIFLVCALSTTAALLVYPVAVEQEKLYSGHSFGYAYYLAWACTLLYAGGALCMCLDDILRTLSRGCLCCRDDPSRRLI